MSSTDTETQATQQDNPNSTAVVPQPPRFTGDPAVDTYQIVNWLWSFYTTAVVATGLLNPSAQATPQGWDPTNLPDPSSTTIATAQQTANLAWEFATLINNSLTHPVTPPTPGSDT